MGSQLLFIFLPYIAFGIFIFGVLFRFWIWIRTPVPLRIVTTPAPKTRWGVVWRLIGDLLWFPTLFKSDKILWAAGLLFHISLWILLLRHLRYFLYPIPKWVEWFQTPGLYAGYIFPLTVIFLFARRLLIDRVLYISLLGDYFSLFLLLTLSISGILLQFFFRTYVIDVKAWVFGLVHFQPQLPRVHWLFLLHLISFLLLIVYFPFSKLLHSGGFLLSPTRYQRAAFMKRHINPWDYPVGYNPENLSPPDGYAQAISRIGKEGSE
jgi:nitrate reductase gamma subunit